MAINHPFSVLTVYFLMCTDDRKPLRSGTATKDRGGNSEASFVLFMENARKFYPVFHCYHYTVTSLLPDAALR